MGFLLDKCKLKKMDDEILSTCHPFTCGDEDLDVLQDKIYLFPKKKNFRERYKRLSQSKWFKKTYNGKTLGEIITVEE